MELRKRICIKFCSSNAVSAIKTYQMFQKAFKGNYFVKNKDIEGHKMFKEYKEFVVDETHNGRLSISTND